jgi:Pectate lyase superfamily protein
MNMTFSRLRSATLIAFLLSVLGLPDGLLFAVQTVEAASIPATGDEFVGPFASWVNVKTAYGAKGDGVSDDTAAFQAAFNDVGVGSNSPVLWVPAGTYKITGTITMVTRLGISVLGEDPTTTIIKWGGASTATGAIFDLNGVAYSRFNRLTFDGSSSQVVLVNQSYDGNANGNFDTGNEYADDVFKNAAFGFECGMRMYGCAEVSLIRDKFLYLSTGVLIGNDNALDVWVRYSLFDHCGYAVTNYIWTGSDWLGSGNLHVYNSVFRNSDVWDVGWYLLEDGTFSVRNSYSTGSAQFIKSLGGNNPAGQIIQGNTVLGTTNPLSIEIFNQGPVLLYDNVIRSSSTTEPSVNVSAYTWGTGSDAVAVGNTFTVTSPISVSPGRLTEIDSSIASRSTLNPAEPVLPGIEPNLHRPMVEVSTGATNRQIQSAINTAVAQYGGQRPVVHIPSGDYRISTGLTVPANSDLQLVGDGYATHLVWSGSGSGPVLSLAGPTKVTIREMQVDGNDVAQGVVASSIDQPGSRVYLLGMQMRDGINSDLFYDGLDYTVVEADDIQTLYSNGPGTGDRIGIEVAGGPLAAAGNPKTGKVNIYSGLAAEKGVAYQVSNGGSLLVRDVYYENKVERSHLQVSGRAIVTLEGQKQTIPTGATSIDIANLVGKVSLLGSSTGGNVVISGNGSQAQVLGAGLFEETADADNYFLNNAAATAGLLQSRVVTSDASLQSRTIPVANQGTIDSAFVNSMLAQTRAATEQPLTALPDGVSDLRLYRVWAISATHNIRLTSGAGPDSPSGTLQICVLSSFSVSFSLPICAFR